MNLQQPYLQCSFIAMPLFKPHKAWKYVAYTAAKDRHERSLNTWIVCKKDPWHHTIHQMWRPAARKNEEQLSQCAWIIQWLCTQKLQRILCCLPWCCFSDLSLDDAKTHAKMSSPELEIYISIHLCSYCNQLYQTSLPITVTNSIHIGEEEKRETRILKCPQTTEEQKIYINLHSIISLGR